VRDPSVVTPVMREAVLLRDGYRCIAPQLDGLAGWCRDTWGNPITRWYGRDLGSAYIQINHVKPEGALAMGRKVVATADNLVSLCPFHHTGTTAGSNWEAANRWKIRRYLEDIYRPSRSMP
jgi:hypothetical protein